MVHLRNNNQMLRLKTYQRISRIINYLNPESELGLNLEVYYNSLA
jgi:hypothetical protein